MFRPRDSYEVCNPKLLILLRVLFILFLLYMLNTYKDVRYDVIRIVCDVT